MFYTDFMDYDTSWEAACAKPRQKFSHVFKLSSPLSQELVTSLYPNPDQSYSRLPFFSILSILILSPHLGSVIDTGLFLSCFLKKTFFFYFFSPFIIRSLYPVFLSLLGLIILIMFGDRSEPQGFWVCSFPQSSFTFSPLAQNCPSGPYSVITSIIDFPYCEWPL
jgi:hypothetical protein